MRIGKVFVVIAIAVILFVVGTHFINSVDAQKSKASPYFNLLVGSWSHSWMNVVYRFEGNGTFQYVISSDDLLVACKGRYRIAGNRLTTQNTEGRVLKGTQYGKACNEEPATVQLKFEDRNTMVLTDEKSGYSDTYKRMMEPARQ